MLDRIVKRDGPIEMSPAFRNVSGHQQGETRHAMPDHERDRRSLFLGECKELRCKLAHLVAVDCHAGGDPDAERTENNSSGSSSGSPSASACSISRRARSSAALVSGAA
jgi:hypothetical protein